MIVCNRFNHLNSSSSYSLFVFPHTERSHSIWQSPVAFLLFRDFCNHTLMFCSAHRAFVGNFLSSIVCSCCALGTLIMRRFNQLQVHLMHINQFSSLMPSLWQYWVPLLCNVLYSSVAATTINFKYSVACLQLLLHNNHSSCLVIASDPLNLSSNDFL